MQAVEAFADERQVASEANRFEGIADISLTLRIWLLLA